MRRTLQFVLLLAFIIPFGMFVRWWVAGMSQRGLDFGSGIVVGMAICYALWRWDDKIRQRATEGKRTFGD